MKTKFGLGAILILAGLLAACNGRIGDTEIIRGSGNVVSEDRPVSGFRAVSLDGVGHLIIDQTGSESLTITADEKFLPYIETSVRDNKLIIAIKGKTIFDKLSDLTYHVTVANLDDLELNGAGEITANNLKGEDLSIALNGAGQITTAGEVARQTVEIQGAGGYQGADLKSQEATVHHAGAGVAVVQVSDQLDVTIDGLGSVEYIGDPVVSKEVNGLGTVKQQE